MLYIAAVCEQSRESDVVYNSAASDEDLILDHSQQQLLIKFTYLLEL